MGLLPVLQGIWDDGDAALLVPPDAEPQRTAALLAHTSPAAVITPGGRSDLDGGAPIDPDTAVVVATSGSTGPPKAVELSHSALDAAVSASLARLDAQPSDQWLCCLPTHHVAGLLVLLRARALGRPALILDRFDVEQVTAARTATHVSLVPTMLRRLLDAGVDLSHLRCVLLGGAAAPRALLDRARAARIPVVATYGMTETAGGCVYDGRPLDGVQVRISEDSTVQVRGPVIFSGYRLQPEATAAALHDGWLHTADLGTLTDGVLTITGRRDDVVISGGVNVSTAAVAEVLTEHPGVVDAAVVGQPDDEWGHRVVAYVVCGSAAPDVEALRAAVRARLGAPATPRQVVFLTELPRLDTGKVDVIALTQRRHTGS